MPQAFGQFIAGLAPWDWWVTITFRDDVEYPDAPVKAIKRWLADVARNAGLSIGYVIAEEFGDWGGRFHCHLLISGVKGLGRRFWWSEAFRRFGRTEIKLFDPDKYVTCYIAKYAAKQLGNLHFGGTFDGKNLELQTGSDKGPPIFQLIEATRVGTSRKEIILSAEIPKTFFQLGLKQWHR